MHHGSWLALHLRLHGVRLVCLGDEAGGKLLVCVCVLKCVIARHKRPLISALRQPLAQPSSFLKCPAVFSLTYNSQVNVSVPSSLSSSWIITDFILACVFNRRILPFIWGSDVQRQWRIKGILSKHWAMIAILGPSTLEEMMLLDSQWIGEPVRQCGLSEQGCAQMAINPTKSCCPLSIMSHNPFLFCESNGLSTAHSLECRAQALVTIAKRGGDREKRAITIITIR